MATRKDDQANEDGVILDEQKNIRHDSGEEFKDAYDSADAYEKDRLELRGIIGFTLGLVVVIVVTFGLMWLMQNAMESQAAAEDKLNTSPMALTAEEREAGKQLPPEPRLQGAPGFGVTTESGFNNLELREPQSEYRALYKDWQKTWKEGRKDPNNGTVITLPIEEAKQRVLQQGLGKTRQPEAAQKALKDAQQITMYSSAGRTMEPRRQ
ncbi:MAG TPA: hypothetical protein VEX64_09265 [Pyrinomonadaceae bacterium]|jgi:hypothetical protein|nr:hypothetical protein [Pyrinomonadaceae bacterium]